MKKPVLITILAILGIGGFLVYNHYFAHHTANPWDLVPEETILVYESGGCQECVAEIKNSPVAEIISRASFPNLTDDSLKSLQKFLLSFSEPTLVSLHSTKKDEFDFAFYLRKTSTFSNRLRPVLQTLMSEKGVKTTQREYQSVLINEIAVKGSVFSFIEVHDVWVGSFSPVIIEDVIRTAADPERSFRNSIGDVFQAHTIKNDGGNLFIHLKHLTQWFSLFTQGATAKVLKEFGHAALLDTKVTDGKFVLNGFCSQSPGYPSFLNSFSDQSPVPFSLKNIISNRAILVSAYGASDGARLYQKLTEDDRNPHLDSLQILFKEINEDPTALLKKFKGEIAMCYLEGRNESLVNIAIIEDEKNIAAWDKLFLKISETTTGDTIFVDTYSNYEIHELPVYRFPEKMFYPLVEGFDQAYYARVGNSLCIAEDINELKDFLSDIDQENTWGKSVTQNQYLESTLSEANISLFINTPKTWNMLSKSLKPRWQKFVEDNQDLLSSVGIGAIQFSHLNENYYTNVSWVIREQAISQKPKVSEKLVTVFESGVSNMWLVKNHSDKSTEVLIQDSLKNIHLIGADGKVQWKLPLDDFVSGNVEQIDFLANGKLQYFFATQGKLHLVDRTGTYVPPYPVAIPEKKIEFISVLDYDHTRKYRFLLSSREGRLWMYDKDGKNLEGWQPRSVDDELIAPADHHRMVGKDYLLAIRKDGVVFLMNRRGELMPNFPLQLNARLSGDYFIDVGRNSAETSITVVSSDGTKIRFNIQGKILSREVLVKTSLDSKFALVKERNSKAYVIVRQEPKLFTVLDDTGNELIKSDYIGNTNVDLRFYSFGNGRTYFVVTDKVQDLSYIYDKSGKLVSPLPVESSTIEILPDDEGKLRVFSITNKAFALGSVP